MFQLTVLIHLHVNFREKFRVFFLLCPAVIKSNLRQWIHLHVEPNKNQHAREREGTPGASYDRARREQESQEDRKARLDRQRLQTNHLTPRQRWLPQLVSYKINCILCLIDHFKRWMYLSLYLHILFYTVSVKDESVEAIDFRSLESIEFKSLETIDFKSLETVEFKSLEKMDKTDLLITEETIETALVVSLASFKTFLK